MTEQLLNFNSPKDNRESQAEMILAHLRAGNTLTVLEALESPFRCYALSQRCGDLRRAGFPIKSEMVKLPSGKRVARYSMEAK